MIPINIYCFVGLTFAFVISANLIPAIVYGRITVEWQHRQNIRTSMVFLTAGRDQSILVGGLESFGGDDPNRQHSNWSIGQFVANIQNLVWYRSYGDSLHSESANLAFCVNEGLILMGERRSTLAHRYGRRLSTLKLDSEGDSLWYCELGQRDVDFVDGSITENDTSYILGTSIDDQRFMTLFMVLPDGESGWRRDYRPEEASYYPRDIALIDNSILISGRYSARYQQDGLLHDWGLLLRLNLNGEILWESFIVDSIREQGGYFHARRFNIQESLIHKDGFVYSCGYMNYQTQLHPDEYLILMKTDLNGDVKWIRHYRDNYAYTSRLNHLFTISDDYIGVFGNVAFEGHPELSGGFIAIADTGGNLVETFVLNEENGYEDIRFGAVCQTSATSFLAVTDYDELALISIEPNLSVAFEDGSKLGMNDVSAFPNSFNSSTTITFADGTPPPVPPASGGGKAAPTRLAVYDLSGRLVVDLLDRQGRLSYGAGGEIAPSTSPASGGETRKVVWEAVDVPAGVYLVRLEAGVRSVTRKIVLMR